MIYRSKKKNGQAENVDNTIIIGLPQLELFVAAAGPATGIATRIHRLVT